MFSPAPGVLIAGRYLLRQLIGSGGMGEVWEAEDRELEGPCAVKFILPRMVPDRETRSRIVREAKITARLRSPHAVHILGVGEHDASPYLAMELLEGETLASLLDRHGKLDADTTLAIVSQVALVLEKARALDIVHRDLKPDNIWLCAQRDVFIKVFDFGIAKAPLQTVQTLSGAVVGTPHYMSPEQLSGTRVDHRADLWALAVITLQCLSGHRPFDAPAVGGLVLRIMSGADSGVRQLACGVSARLEPWAARALAVDPAERFQSATELVEALRLQLLSSTRLFGAQVPTPSSAPRTPPSVAAAEASSPPTSHTEPLPAVTRTHAGARGTRALAALALAALVGALLVIVWPEAPAASDARDVKALAAPASLEAIAAPALLPAPSVDAPVPAPAAPSTAVVAPVVAAAARDDAPVTAPPKAPASKPSVARAALQPTAHRPAPPPPRAARPERAGTKSTPVPYATNPGF